MTPEDEREGQYADERAAALPLDVQERLLTDWGQYLIDREHADLPVRHRDFSTGSPVTTRTCSAHGG